MPVLKNTLNLPMKDDISLQNTSHTRGKNKMNGN